MDSEDNRVIPNLEFFERNSSILAKDILGAEIIIERNNIKLGGIIVETEAYLSERDRASHSFPGKSARNNSMFLSGGHIYVYRIYGIHFCFNIVTGLCGSGEAVLIRAIEPLEGKEIMADNRKIKFSENRKDLIKLCNGPAKICQAFGITIADDGKVLQGSEFKLKLHKPLDECAIGKSERIGITKSKELQLRYYIKGNEFVSGKKYT